MFERRYCEKSNSAKYVQDNEIGKTKGLVNGHVPAVQVMSTVDGVKRVLAWNLNDQKR
jgi:hypothetical protein